MKSTTLIVPGLYGSGADHWQTWLESRIPGARRVLQDDWSAAALESWSGRVREAIDLAVGQVWIVAHSFGCLAAVTAAVDRADRVAGALLVAPANPERFTARGLAHIEGVSAAGFAAADVPVAPDTPEASAFSPGTITPMLPHHSLGFPAIVVASSNDPWMRLTAATVWADRWGAQFECIGRAGHINTESGFGPWAQGLELFERFRKAHGGEPLGAIEAFSATTPASPPPSTGANRDAFALRGERMLNQQWLA